MQKLTLLFCVLTLTLALAIGARSTNFIPSPVLLWSGNTFLSGQQRSIAHGVNSDAVERVLSGLLQLNNDASVNDFVRDAANPEVVLLFTKDQLSTFAFQQLANANKVQNIQALIEKSASSVVAPYTELNTQMDGAIASLIASVASRGAKTFIHANGASLLNQAGPTHTEEELFEYLQSQKEIYANKKSDLIVVELTSDLEAGDALVGRVSDAVRAKTDSFVAVLLPLTASVATDNVALSESEYCTYELELTQNNNTNGTIHRSYFPPDVAEGLMVGLVLLIALVIGIYCAFSLQVPDRFEGGQLNRDSAQK